MHAQEEIRGSENTERARDSRAHKRTVRDELRQGGETGERIPDSPPEERLAFYVSTSQPHFFVLAGNIRHSVGPIHFEGFFERGQQVFH